MSDDEYAFVESMVGDPNLSAADAEVVAAYATSHRSWLAMDRERAHIRRAWAAFFEDHDPIWSSGKKKDEDYPWRVPIGKGVSLPREGWVPAEGLARKLTYVQKWPAEHWRLAFQGNVHEISESDFEILRSEIDKAASQAA